MDRLVISREDKLTVVRPGSRNIIEFMRSGIPGRKGDPGDIGPSGSIGTVFQYDQVSANATWIVNHNLGRYPISVRVLSPGKVEVEANVVDISVNQLQVLFSSPQTGSVRIV